MRILITNDDGIHATGLRVLERIARELSDDVWVVAPETDQSGKAHSLSLSDPLRLRKISDRHFAVRGTPTDCVIMGVRHILPAKPTLVLSGIAPGTLINVNFPARAPTDVSGVAITSQGARNDATIGIDPRIDGRGNPYFWIHYRPQTTTPGNGTDLEALARGAVSVTPLRLDLTDHAAQERLKERFSA